MKHTVSVREEENLDPLEDIRLLYDQVNGVYGYRRITMTVNRRRRQHGLPAYNEKCVHRLMRIHGYQYAGLIHRMSRVGPLHR